MLKALSDFSIVRSRGAGDESAEDRAQALRVATALLLIEVARADYAGRPAEDAAVFAAIKKFFRT